MKNELKTRPCLKPVFEIISNRDANFHVAINNYLITHFTKQTLHLNYLLLKLNVTVQLLNYSKTEKPILSLNFKFSLNGGDLSFWFTFNLAVDFRPKMALMLEILSDQIHTLPRNSAKITLSVYVAVGKFVCDANVGKPVRSFFVYV